MRHYLNPGGVLVYTIREKGRELIETRPRLLEFAKKIKVLEPTEWSTNIDYSLEQSGRSVVDSDEIIPGMKYTMGDFGKNLGHLYRAVKEVKIPGQSSSSVVMEKIKGEDYVPPTGIAHLYLSKYECETLGISYQPKYIIFPIEMGWRRVGENWQGAFNEEDLSTYPESKIQGRENSIHYMLLQVPGFSQTGPEVINTPGGHSLDTEAFLCSLKITIEVEISRLAGWKGIKKDTNLEFTIIGEDFSDHRYQTRDHIIDTSGNLNLIVKLGNGVNVMSLKKKNPEDLFDISWNISFAADQPSRGLKETIMRHEEPLFEKRNGRWWRKV